MRGGTTPAARLSEALRSPRKGPGPALAAFLTAGFPSRERFAAALGNLGGEADLLEIGVPFSDPMADGVTIQRASRAALELGVTLRWILDTVAALPRPRPVPLVLMSYLNPLLSAGLEVLARESAEAGISGFVVPDLPLEECAPFREALEEAGLALIQMVSPVTPEARMRDLCGASHGFVYAVTLTGTTGSEGPGGRAGISPDLAGYLRRVRACSPVPVLAGFGIRRPEQVEAIGREVDGVIVGSALLEEMERGGDPAAFLRSLRGGSSRERGA